MYVALFCLIGIVAMAVISAQAWRDRARVAASVTPDWHDTLRRLATEQELGHYRSAREKTVSVLRRLESRRFDPRMAELAGAEQQETGRGGCQGGAEVDVHIGCRGAA